jgi:hypothetical protein
MDTQTPAPAEPYEPPTVADLPTDGPNTVCAMIITGVD